MHLWKLWTGWAVNFFLISFSDALCQWRGPRSILVSVTCAKGTPGHMRSRRFFANNFLQKIDTDARVVSCSASQGASNDMLVYLFWPNLTSRSRDLRSNFDLDLSRSSYTCIFWTTSTRETRWRSPFCSSSHPSRVIDEKIFGHFWSFLPVTSPNEWNP